MKQIQIGEVFGRWEVIGDPDIKKDRRNRSVVNYPCQCECGHQQLVRRRFLLDGQSKGCGPCHRKDVAKGLVKHGMSKTKLYDVWSGIKHRCYYPSNKWFCNYGAKGIGMCDEWRNDASAFLDWALSSGYKEGLSIDRIDSAGNYEPSNCRWATRFDQGINRNVTRFFEAFGETKSFQEWLLDPRCVVSHPTTINGRLTRNWSFSKAISTPPLSKP